jgi:hypothetical protein
VFLPFHRASLAKAGMPEQNGQTHAQAGDIRAEEASFVLKTNDPAGGLWWVGGQGRAGRGLAEGWVLRVAGGAELAVCVVDRADRLVAAWLSLRRLLPGPPAHPTH